ncbi:MULTISPECIES: F0F1 ATP synthase subunit gamma [unclassified Roseitalea]|uniref:F0F1 ATP synthase subunit gamma n=1 Tax=unclassified Roseitalea TaxID=2639107 RepID=UPI00273F9844|nr:MULTISPECIES: F0F1 ATP synthase subunit gamma [unclassified Roseitalea]
METLEALAARLETTEDIQSIVRTMKSLSSASIRQYEHAVEAMVSYERAVELGLQAVLRQRRIEGERAPAGQERRHGHRRAMIVIGSDRGLCGRFNDRIANFARQTIDEDARGDTTPRVFLCVIGLRAAARLEAAGHRADRIFTLPGSVAGLAGMVQTVAIEVDRWSSREGVTRVDVVYNRRNRQALAEPVRRALLPVPRSYLEQLSRRPWPSRALPLFRMHGAQLFDWLIGQHLFVVLYRSLAESLASEHASRLAAMQSAERNIKERHEDLQSQFRKKRQETITRELLDVVAGFESAQSGRIVP